MVESTGFEIRHTGNRIGGSNPPLSATHPIDMEEEKVIPGKILISPDVSGG